MLCPPDSATRSVRAAIFNGAAAAPTARGTGGRATHAAGAAGDPAAFVAGAAGAPANSPRALLEQQPPQLVEPVSSSTLPEQRWDRRFTAAALSARQGAKVDGREEKNGRGDEKIGTTSEEVSVFFCPIAFP